MYTVQETVEYDGLTWHRYPNALRRNDREYFSRGSKSLHRYVWEKHNGPIPKGYVIHHIDGNCQNNDISNLECITSEAHNGDRHKPTGERLQQLRDNIKYNALPKAVEWHKSEQAKEFHRRIAKMAWDNFEPTVKKCIVCGTPFSDNSRQQTGKFCSGACSQKHKRMTKITKKCELCGKEFQTGKYSKAKYCSRSCRAKVGHDTRKNNTL